MIFFGVFVFTRPAEAGLLSFIGDLFKGSEIKQTEVVVNSQTMLILEATKSSDLQAGVGGAENTYADASALVPVTGPLGSIADVALEEHKSDQISLYIVRKGDTLSGIAKLFNVHKNTIVWANDELRNGGALSPGMMLAILPVDGIKYKVQKGDTVAKIAKKYKADKDEIIAFNDINIDESLEVGSEIIIPDGEVEAPQSSGGYIPPTSGDKTYAGYYLRPLVGGRKTQGLHGRNGVDLGGVPIDTPVLASASGDIIIARSSGWNGGYGKYIVIQHPNGTQTLYGHLNGLEVGVGWHVVQGQVIGYLGNTGKSTGKHLHFEIRGGPRNPF
jgi:murein DD-endopeptidase MepM/ murein hydrolase activator NlpD